MFDYYTIVVHKKLNVVIMVPNQWPARAGPLLMTLVEKIVERFRDSSPIVRVNGTPTRLIRRNAPAGAYYVFNLVAPKEIVGAYVYDVIVPENEEAIRLEITSGTTLNAASWSAPPPKCPSTHIEKIYQHLSLSKLRRKVLSVANSNKHTPHHRRQRRKRVYRPQRKRDIWDRMRYNHKTGQLCGEK